MHSKSLAIVIALSTASSFAQQVTRPFFQASRALAMGDAFTGYDAGYEAVYYNPAGVARPSEPHGKYLDIEATGSTDLYLFLKNTTKSFASISDLAKNLTSNPGAVDAVGLAILPQFMAKNFSIGLIGRAYSQSEVDPTTLNMNFDAYSDLGVYTQFGASFFGGVLKIGVGAKALDRAELNQVFTPAEYASSLSLGSQWQEGIGYGADAGFLLTAPVSPLPTLGVSVLDIGNTTFHAQHLLFTSGGGAEGPPPPIPQRVNVGTSLTFKNGPGLKTVVSADLKDVLHLSEGYTDRICAGMEINVHDFLFLRGGLYEGVYWTAGLGLKVAKVNLEFATYGENLLAGTGQVLNDRKLVLRYVLGF